MDRDASRYTGPSIALDKALPPRTPAAAPRVVGRRSDVPLRVGGKWRTEGKPFSVSGEYTRVDPPKALGFTRNHDWGDGEM